jgi:putative acetyltransferase
MQIRVPRHGNFAYFDIFACLSMMTAPVIRAVDPTSPAIRPIIAAHLAHSDAVTPPESRHAMAPEALRQAGVTFWAMFEGQDPVAIGALKWLGAGRAEVKSMHVTAQARGRGLAQRMLDHLVAEARARAVTVLVLETGSALIPAFDPARRLYELAGFAYCPPFAPYVDDPMSVFMFREL